MTTGNKRYIFFTNSRIAKVLKYTVTSISSNSVLKKLDLLQFHCLNTCVSLLNGSISFCHYSYNLHVMEFIVWLSMWLILQSLIFHQTAFPREVSITGYCIFFFSIHWAVMLVNQCLHTVLKTWKIKYYLSTAVFWSSWLILINLLPPSVFWAMWFNKHWAYKYVCCP